MNPAKLVCQLFAKQCWAGSYIQQTSQYPRLFKKLTNFTIFNFLHYVTQFLRIVFTVCCVVWKFNVFYNFVLICRWPSADPKNPLLLSSIHKKDANNYQSQNWVVSLHLFDQIWNYGHQIQADDFRIKITPKTLKKIELVQFYMQIECMYHEKRKILIKSESRNCRPNGIALYWHLSIVIIVFEQSKEYF